MTPYSFAVFGDWGFVHRRRDEPRSGERHASDRHERRPVRADHRRQRLPLRQSAELRRPRPGRGGHERVFGPNFWTVVGLDDPALSGDGKPRVLRRTTALNNWPEDVAVATSNGRRSKETYCCLNDTTSATTRASGTRSTPATRASTCSRQLCGPIRGPSTPYGNDYAYHWTPDRAEYKWLQNDLATHPRPLKFAFFHYPLYSDSASENTDDFLHGADSLEGLLSRYGVDFGFPGHAHIYERNTASTNGLPSYTTGGGGADLESIAGGSANCSPFDAYGIGWSDTSQLGNACGSAPVPTSASQVFHFLKVGVNASGVTVTPTDSQGQAFDEQTYQVSPANADLSLTSSESADPVITDQVVTYRLAAHNGGSSDARGVVVTDSLPTGVEYVSAASSQGTCLQAAGTVTCALGSLASGADATVDVSVKSPSAGTVINKASIVGDDLIDPAEANNFTTESTTVQAGANLSLTQSDSPDPVVAGENLTYTLAVHNGGPLDANNVVVADDLPSGTTYRSATPSQGTCSEGDGTVACFLGALANGTDATVQIVVTPPSTGTITNGASTASDEPDGDDANNYASETTTVTQLADLSVTNSDSPDPVGVGQTLTYTLTVHDSGPADAPSVRVTDTLPGGVVYQSATPSQGSCAQASGTVTCDIGAIASGGGATVTIKVTPQTAGSITNSASVTSTGTVDPSPANDSASASTTVKTVADLSITNTDSPDPCPSAKR